MALLLFPNVRNAGVGEKFQSFVLALLTRETRGEYTHCWNERGETVETIWRHNGRDTVIPDNRDHAIPKRDSRRGQRDPQGSGLTCLRKHSDAASAVCRGIPGWKRRQPSRRFPFRDD
jgi:hypothetical protein